MKKLIAALAVSALCHSGSAWGERVFVGSAEDGHWTYEATHESDLLHTAFDHGSWGAWGVVARTGRGDDEFLGTPSDDVIFGGPGDDNLIGGLGNDFLIGGRGNDRLRGTPGDDILIGGPGQDLLEPGSGNDFMYGGKGKDTYSHPYAGRNTVLLHSPTDNDVFEQPETREHLTFEEMRETYPGVRRPVSEMHWPSLTIMGFTFALSPEQVRDHGWSFATLGIPVEDGFQVFFLRK